MSVSRVDAEDRIMNVFKVSNRQGGWLDKQVDNISKEHLMLNVQRGEYVKSKADEYRQANGLAPDKKLDAHERGQIAELHSWGRYHKFSSCMKGFARFCGSEYGVRNLSDITPGMAEKFCNTLADLEYSRNSVNGYISALEKFGAFTKQDFHTTLKDWKDSEKYNGLLDKDITPRAYAQPERIIDALGQLPAKDNIINDKAAFSARLGMNYGLRINDACHFKILDNNKIMYNSKNGMKTERVLTPEDYRKAVALSEGGKYNLSVNTLKEKWSNACDAARVENNGFHGLRHNFAQNTYNSLISEGKSHTEACRLTSNQMNHSRPEITERYLR